MGLPLLPFDRPQDVAHGSKERSCTVHLDRVPYPALRLRRSTIEDRGARSAMKRLAMAVASVLGAAALSLVGTGAYAYDLGSSSSSSEPGHGESSVVLSASGAAGNGTTHLVLAAAGPFGSSFTSGLTPVTITNVGHAAAVVAALGLGDRTTNRTLRGETWACVIVGGRVLANEPLTTIEGYGQAGIPALRLKPEGTGTFAVVYYAGPTESTGCGGAMTFYHARGGYGTGVPYPIGTSNTSSPSLTNGAQGGALLVTVRITSTADDHRCKRHDGQWRHDGPSPHDGRSGDHHDCD